MLTFVFKTEVHLDLLEQMRKINLWVIELLFRQGILLSAFVIISTLSCSLPIAFPHLFLVSRSDTICSWKPMVAITSQDYVQENSERNIPVPLTKMTWILLGYRLSEAYFEPPFLYCFSFVSELVCNFCTASLWFALLTLQESCIVSITHQSAQSEMLHRPICCVRGCLWTARDLNCFQPQFLKAIVC